MSSGSKHQFPAVVAGHKKVDAWTISSAYKF